MSPQLPEVVPPPPQPVAAQDPPSPPQAPSGSKSYSDIVKKLTAAAARRSQPALIPALTPGPSSHQQKPLPAQSQSPQLYSLYVSQLHEQSSASDLNKTFSVFGHVHSIDFSTGRSFAFVKFDSPISLKAALDAASVYPIEDGFGKPLTVEEKTGASRGGGGPRRDRRVS